MFDAHTHIQFPAYDDDREEVLWRAQVAGVKMIAVGTNLVTSREAVVLAEKYPDDIWATVGFHPSHVVLDDEKDKGGHHQNWYWDKKELRSPQPEFFVEQPFTQLAAHQKVVAIGECGLDYFRLPTMEGQKNKIKKAQKDVFIQQINLAAAVNKPLMIH